MKQAAELLRHVASEFARQVVDAEVAHVGNEEAGAIGRLGCARCVEQAGVEQAEGAAGPRCRAAQGALAAAEAAGAEAATAAAGSSTNSILRRMRRV